MIRAAATALASAAIAAAGAGCGLGPGPTTGGVHLLVTRDFGDRVLIRLDRPRTSGQDTVMRLLERNAAVQTRYGGGFVQSIDGTAGGEASGRPVDWFFYVNGVESPTGAAAVRLHPGDRVWWDHHDWGATMETPAVIGAFPEPFLHGLDGRRLPVRVECAAPRSAACGRVDSRLVAAGIPAAEGGLGAAQGSETLRVLVGPWAALRGDPAAGALEGGPSPDGVYARPGRSGGAIDLLDATGRAVRRLTAGGGLIAATRRGESVPVWLITGTDDAGVDGASRAFGSSSLRDRFAVATLGPSVLALPVGARPPGRSGSA